MDTIEMSRIMAFDLVNSLITENTEHVLEIINSAIAMGPEHTRFFIMIFAHVFDGVQESVRDTDLEHHQYICNLIKYPPKELLEFYRTFGGAVE